MLVVVRSRTLALPSQVPPHTHVKDSTIDSSSNFVTSGSQCGRPTEPRASRTRPVVSSRDLRHGNVVNLSSTRCPRPLGAVSNFQRQDGIYRVWWRTHWSAEYWRNLAGPEPRVTTARWGSSVPPSLSVARVDNRPFGSPLITPPTSITLAGVTLVTAASIGSILANSSGESSETPQSAPGGAASAEETL